MTHPFVSPFADILRSPGTVGTLVVMITRGRGDLAPVADAMRQSAAEEAGFALVARYPAVEAKNRAVALVDRCNSEPYASVGLLLIEDDILASETVWRRALAHPHSVRLATTRNRTGSSNTRWKDDGSVLCSGTPFVYVPPAVLGCLPRPIFQAVNYHLVSDGSIAPREENAFGRGSDIHFWYLLHQLDPLPRIEVVGEVTHLLPESGDDRHSLDNPCSVRAA